MRGLVKINEEILKRGYVDVKVNVQGMRQSHRLHLKREKTPKGELVYLEAQHYIPNSELVRLANQLNLPVKHKNTLVFPKGKMPKDFVLEVQPAEVEAEIES